MFTCSECGYNTTDKSNYLRHCNRKTACGSKKQAVIHNDYGIKNNETSCQSRQSHQINNTGPTNNISSIINHNIEIDKETHQGKCPRCERMISKKHIKKHIEICKGVPRNTCGVCFRIFTTQQSHSRHQKICKKKKRNSYEYKL